MTENQHQTQYPCELCALAVNTILHCKSHDNQSLINMYPGKDCDLDECTIMPTQGKALGLTLVQLNMG